MTNVFLEFDLAGAEWVVVAYASGDLGMIEVAASGESPHIPTGALISGASEAFVEEESKVVGLHTDPTTIARLRGSLSNHDTSNIFLPRTMSIRQAAKKANHGLNYDEGYRTFALMNEIAEDEAKRIRQSYLFEAYPGIPRWHERTRAQLGEDRTLINPLGRKCRLLDIWGQDLFRKAYAFVPQSTVFDIVRNAMIAIQEDSLLDDVEQMAQVHDSILTQFSYDPSRHYLANFINQIRRIVGYMEPQLELEGRKFTIAATIKMGMDWGNMIEVTIGDGDEALRGSLEAAWHQIQQSSN